MNNGVQNISNVFNILLSERGAKRNQLEVKMSLLFQPAPKLPDWSKQFEANDTGGRIDNSRYEAFRFLGRDITEELIVVTSIFL